MGLTASLSTSKLPDRKSNRTPVLCEYEYYRTFNEVDNRPSSHRSNLACLQRSSFRGRLRSFAALLHRTPSPMSSADEGAWDHTSIPSSVENDVISTQRPSWSFTDAGSALLDTLASSFASDRSVAVLTPTDRKPPATPVTPSSLLTSIVRASPSASGALVPVLSSSRLGGSKLGSSTAASFEITSLSAVAATSTTLVNSALQVNAPVVRCQRLPNLRLGELEQIFAAVVTSDDRRGRTKLSLSE